MVEMLYSDSALNEKVAKLGPSRRMLKRVADLKATAARGILAAHHHSGDSKITVTKGTLDYFVSLDDSRGQRAAAAIEYGHIARNGRMVPGIHSLGGGL